MSAASPTRNKHDVIRERRLQKKLNRVASENAPKTQDTGLKRARCPICGEKYVVNNYPDRKVRVKRVLGVAVCANCFYRRGTERLVRIYKLAKELAALDLDGFPVSSTGEVIKLSIMARWLVKR